MRHSLQRSARQLTVFVSALTALLSSAVPVDAAAPTREPVEAPASDRALAALVGTVSGAGLVGRSTVPLNDASVYAYRVTDLTLHKAETDRRGGFSFLSLPAGVYKVVAHKSGFLPAVVLVTRATASAFQELQLQLFPDEVGVTEARSDRAADFWEIRRRIPTDVLQEIQVAIAEDAEPDYQSELAPALSATMHAVAGSGEFAGLEQASVVGGHFDLEGQVGEVALGLVGNFRTLQNARMASTLGHSQSMALSVDHDQRGTLKISSTEGSVDSAPYPVDLETYGVDWSGETGRGRTEVAASMMEESNYYRDPRVDLFRLPTASRTLELEGSYQQRIGERSGLRTGVRYRERESLPRADSSSSNEPFPDDRMEIFGLGDFDLRPSLSVQYGLFTTLRDGSVAFTPHGALVFDLNRHWTAETAVRQRLHQSDEDWRTDFVPTHYGRQSRCTSAEAACYRLQLTGDFDEKGTVRIGGLHRRYADTLRLFFEEDLFDELDSLYFVEGDALPELHFSYSRRLGPNVVSRIESNIARGGGGSIHRGSDRLENDVRYLVTSIDTQFEGSQTGVLLSFHSLEQRFLDEHGREALESIEQDRVQILLTQGISGLVGLGQELELILDMQLSRSANQQLTTSGEEFRRRVLGGIALRF